MTKTQTTPPASTSRPLSEAKAHMPTLELVERLGILLRDQSLSLATAESCTGGLISSTLTDVPGSSDWFVGGVVAYANRIKEGVLGVEHAVLGAHGAVSEPVVRAMALGVRRVMGADVGVAVSGIAGPTGGTPDKPVGTVWMAWDVEGERESELHRFSGSRAEVKAVTVLRVVEGLLERLERGPGEAA